MTQTTALCLAGATDAEITLMLGDASAPVKPSAMTIKRRLRQLGMDVLPMPSEKARRLLELAAVARIEYYKGKQ